MRSPTPRCSKKPRSSSQPCTPPKRTPDRTAKVLLKSAPSRAVKVRRALQKVPVFPYLFRSCESGGMADALELGCSAVRRGGSSPPSRTKPENTGGESHGRIHRSRTSNRDDGAEGRALARSPRAVERGRQGHPLCKENPVRQSPPGTRRRKCPAAQLDQADHRTRLRL